MKYVQLRNKISKCFDFNMFNITERQFNMYKYSDRGKFCISEVSVSYFILVNENT